MNLLRSRVGDEAIPESIERTRVRGRRSHEGDRAVLQPAVVVPIERYTEERTSEFDEAAQMSPDEIRKARRKWRL